ncbi:MBL fold metallo-hydrolase [Actinacidiphila sp. DG2A-62]|uniref:MBL fold metallo-hydrolase n=1 Tax=Actinacidiphila sp. DG2A-62 TaxID=3108821 RepID=UPI002DB5D2D3|nr:MBL fold metallo-hydrolase [Actinacidiphila sp. DG2A-62]MEC3992742.1 MBL fold metallo-hydrolase [Actinacidiphila sp. DG2A-62]
MSDGTDGGNGSGTSTGDDPAVRIRFIGNATLLIRYGALTLLTDPNFLHRGQYAYLGYGLFSRRLTEPVLSVRELPALDAVLLSHLHGDHWDRTARRELDRSLPVLTTPHAARRLHLLHGFHRAAGLRDWQEHTLTRGRHQVRLTALPARHAGHGPLRLLLPPVMGSLLEFGPADGPVRVRVYVSGDTMLFGGLREIARRFPVLDVGVLHLGGTRLPGGFTVTLDGERGAALAGMLRPHHVLPVHYDDYTVMKSPLSDFLSAAERRSPAWVVPWRHGQEVVIAPGAGTMTVV